jgi:hypothetical protein
MLCIGNSLPPPQKYPTHTQFPTNPKNHVEIRGERKKERKKD